MAGHDDPEDLPEVLPAEPPSFRRKDLAEDRLEGYWKAIIWGSLLIPCLGGWIIVVLSSVMYYVWIGTYPKKAKSINMHGWLAWFTGQAIALAVYLAISALGNR
jgi:hypothetical protein